MPNLSFRKATLFILLLGLLFACNSKDNLIPGYSAGVLSKRKMIDIMVDINLAESGLRVANVQHTQSADSTYQRSLFLEVFKSHNVTPDEFSSSLDYYTRHVDDMNEIFSAVIEKLTGMQAELQAKRNGQKKDPKGNPTEGNEE